MSFFKELGQQFGSHNQDVNPNESSLEEDKMEELETSNKVLTNNDISDIKCLSVKPIANLTEVSKVSWIKINKIVYEKDTSFVDNLSTIYTALHETAKTVIMVIQKEKNSLIELYLGVYDKPNVNNHISKYVLERAIGGCMPGIDFEEQAPHIMMDKNKVFVTSVSGQPILKSDNKSKFDQGIEKLINSTSDMPTFTIVFIAENESNEYISQLYDKLTKDYSALSEISETTKTDSTTKTETKQTTNTKGSSSTDTTNDSDTTNESEAKSETQSSTESNSGGFGFFLSGNQSNSQSTTLGITKTGGTSKTKGTSLAKGDTHSVAQTTGDNLAKGNSIQKKIEDKAIKEKLKNLGKKIEQLQLKDSLGIWSFSTYCITDTQTSSIVLASIYKGLIVGNQQATDPYSINAWDAEQSKEIVKYLVNCQHPQFESEDNSIIPSVFVSTYELSIGMSLPQSSVPGILVKEQAKFGRNVLISGEQSPSVLRIGNISHMGREELKNYVELDENQLTSHVLITGSTGSGKSNTIYTFLSRLKGEGKKFLIIEPAKGEYKKVLGGLEDVRVLGTNPQMMSLIKINPFSFPKGIHVEEHIDRLIDIFNACWPMYAAMPAVLKESICRAYESCGWDLIRSKSNYGVFPTFDDVRRELNQYVNESEYSSDSKGDYKGALGTRLESLTNGIIGQIFAGKSLADEELFNQNVIIDLSRVGSVETKSLIMGLLIIKLNEFRMSENVGMNLPLRHITVLEEAHNLLRETSGAQSQESANVAGKSVEMLASAIAEMRSYGECFVIADQSPSLLDRAAISNTNTKIVMNLPSRADREIVANSIGLSDQQMNELSKLKTGIAVVYQKGWEEPVQCLVDRYDEMNSYSYDLTEKSNELERTFIEKLYSGYTDIPRFDSLISDLQSIGLSGYRIIRIMNLLDDDEIEVDELCAKILVIYVGESLFVRASKADNIADFNFIIEQGLEKIEGIDRINVQTFLNMYVKGCSLMNKTNFYENWLKQNVELKNRE